MSAPTPMLCLRDRCPSPLSCNHAGECAARRDDSARSYEAALAACREQNRIPKSWEERG